MLARRLHTTQGRDEAILVADEKRRRQRAQEDVRRRLKEALLSGSVFFRGNDRSPSEGMAELKPALEQLLERVLPEVFDKFEEGAAKVRGQDLEALLTAENLQGLPAVFSALKLVLLYNPGKTEGVSGTLDSRLVTKHPGWPLFPRFGITQTFGHIFGDLYWMSAVFAVNFAFDRN